MYDGATFFDYGANLTTLAASIKPSRYVPKELQPHTWVLSKVCESPESPKAESEPEMTPAVTTTETAIDGIFTGPSTPQAGDEIMVPGAKIAFKIPPPPPAVMIENDLTAMNLRLQGGVDTGEQSPICERDSKLSRFQSNGEPVASSQSSPKDRKVSLHHSRTLVDSSIPSAFRDERRESNRELHPTSPAASISKSSEQWHDSGNVHESRKGFVNPNRSCKRLRGADVIDEEFQRPHGFGRHVCVHCWASDLHCDAQAQCKPCTQDGVECVRMRCRFGLGCRYAKCVYLHPGQWDEKDSSWIVHSGSMPPWGVDAYGLTEARARIRERYNQVI